MTTLGSRINVIGTSGCGKTTMARNIAQRLDIPHVELDALHWLPNWMETPLEEFRAKVSAALEGDAWTIDGNYSKVRDIVWGRADTVVWLDYSLSVVMTRVIWRTFRRGILREELWGTNRERLIENLVSEDSIIRWSWNTYQRRKKEYPLLFQRPENAHLKIIRIETPKEGRRLLESL